MRIIISNDKIIIPVQFSYKISDLWSGIVSFVIDNNCLYIKVLETCGIVGEDKYISISSQGVELQKIRFEKILKK